MSPTKTDRGLMHGYSVRGDDDGGVADNASASSIFLLSASNTHANAHVYMHTCRRSSVQLNEIESSSSSSSSSGSSVPISD